MDNKILSELQNQIRLFQSILNYAGAVIGAKDLDGRYIYVNEEYSRLFHIDEDNFIGNTDYDLFPHKIAKSFSEADKLVIAKKHVVTVEEKAPVDGELRDYLSVKFPIFNEQGVIFATGLVATDITDRKKDEQKIYKLANTDHLTQLCNRAHFNQRFDETIKLAIREKKKLALLMIDLDKFKPVNDEYGHQVGDEILQKTADILNQACRETDIVARIGGDEFSIVLVYPDSRNDIELVAQRIIDEIRKPILTAEHKIYIGASIGISIFPDDDKDKDKLIYKADMALYKAKNNGRNNLKFHEKDNQ